MEILQFTEKHHDFRKRLRVFLAEKVTPYVDQWEKEKINPNRYGGKWVKTDFYVLK